MHFILIFVSNEQNRTCINWHTHFDCIGGDHMEIGSVNGACTQIPPCVRVLQLFLPEMSGRERQMALNATRALLHYIPFKSCLKPS